MKRIEPRGTVIKCEKCGGRIKPGEEIKIGGIRKKYFHPKCYEQVEKVRMATYTLWGAAENRGKVASNPKVLHTL
jgi:hypothetical protein